MRDGCFTYKEHLDGFKRRQSPFCGVELAAASRERMGCSPLCRDSFVSSLQEVPAYDAGLLPAELPVASEQIRLMEQDKVVNINPVTTLMCSPLLRSPLALQHLSDQLPSPVCC